jgi:hypothetical protein
MKDKNNMTKLFNYIVNYIVKNVELLVFFILVTLLAILILRRTWEGFFNEQHGINRLDAIIYVNLENRQDRKDLLMKELEKLNANMSKVHKVSGVFIPKNGHKGCIQSHILALHMIKLNKWKRVLILEDDAELNIEPELFNNSLIKMMDILDEKDPNWNVIMLGTANKVINDKVNDINMEIYGPDGKLVPLKVQRLHSATTSSAYIVKDTYVESILGLFSTCNDNMEHGKLSGNGFEFWALDQKWSQLQEKDNWYCLDKDPIKQRAIWSTIISESHS